MSSLSLASGRPSRLTLEIGVIVTLWRRDCLRLIRERTRWIGVVLQPLLFWFMIGSGMSESFSASAAQGQTALEYFFPGILAMVVLFTSIFSTMSVIEDRNSGFLQAVMVAPGSNISMVIGKTAGVTTIVLAQALLFLLVSPFAGYPLGQISWLALLLVLVIGNVALTAINFVFAWLINSTGGYHALMAVVLMPLWIVSGAMFPAPGGWMRWVVMFNPMSYLVSGIRAAMAPQLTFATPLPTSLAVLIAEMCVFFGLAVLATRKRES